MTPGTIPDSQNRAAMRRPHGERTELNRYRGRLFSREGNFRWGLRLLYQESPDGRYLYFCGAREGGKGFGSFWRVPVEGGEAEQILSPFSKSALSFRDEGLYFLDPAKTRSPDLLVALKLLDTETSETTDLGRVVDPPSPRDFSLSPDGRFVLTSHDEPGTADIMLVDDFR